MVPKGICVKWVGKIWKLEYGPQIVLSTASRVRGRQELVLSLLLIRSTINQCEIYFSVGLIFYHIYFSIYKRDFNTSCAFYF